MAFLPLKVMPTGGRAWAFRRVDGEEWECEKM